MHVCSHAHNGKHLSLPPMTTCCDHAERTRPNSLPHSCRTDAPSCLSPRHLPLSTSHTSHSTTRAALGPPRPDDDCSRAVVQAQKAQFHCPSPHTQKRQGLRLCGRPLSHNPHRCTCPQPKRPAASATAAVSPLHPVPQRRPGRRACCPDVRPPLPTSTGYPSVLPSLPIPCGGGAALGPGQHVDHYLAALTAPLAAFLSATNAGSEILTYLGSRIEWLGDTTYCCWARSSTILRYKCTHTHAHARLLRQKVPKGGVHGREREARHRALAHHG